MKSKLIEAYRLKIFNAVCALEVGKSYTTEEPLDEKDRVWLITKLPRKYGETRKFITRFQQNDTLTITRIQ